MEYEDEVYSTANDAVWDDRHGDGKQEGTRISYLKYDPELDRFFDARPMGNGCTHESCYAFLHTREQRHKEEALILGSGASVGSVDGTQSWAKLLARLGLLVG